MHPVNGKTLKEAVGGLDSDDKKRLVPPRSFRRGLEGRFLGTGCVLKSPVYRPKPFQTTFWRLSFLGVIKPE